MKINIWNLENKPDEFVMMISVKNRDHLFLLNEGLGLHTYHAKCLIEQMRLLSAL